MVAPTTPRCKSIVTSTPLDIDASEGQLFLDDHLIEQTVRLRRVVHQPFRYWGNPVYVPSAPWEGTGVVYLGGVHIDPTDGVWKAWYATLNPPAYPEITYAVCMLVSTDGFHWERPELDVVRGHNSEWTNIVLDMGDVGGTGAPSIIHEPDNEAEPWTLIISSCAHGTWDYRGYILRSADGVHWRWERAMPDGVAHGMNDRCTAMRGPDPEFPYVLLSRGNEDSKRWGLVRSSHRVAINAAAADGPPQRILTPDLEDDPAGQIYHAYGFRYESTYVGLFQWYWEHDWATGEMELLTSRDTVTWQRLRPRTPFFSPSPGGGRTGAYDAARTDTALAAPVRTGRSADPDSPAPDMETLWFYSWGGPAMHGDRHLTFGATIGLAQLRADGFCSLRASRFPGTLVTKPFVWPGGRLLLNGIVLGGGGAGSMRTAVLREDLTEIDALSTEQADSLVRDGVRQEQQWGGDGSGIERLAGKTVRLKFSLDNADLFSFRASG